MSLWKGFWRKLEASNKPLEEEPVGPLEAQPFFPWAANAAGVEPSDSASGGTAFSVQSFGLTLLREEIARAPEENVLISPLSVFLALSMAESGALGETKISIRKALALPADASDESIHVLAAKLLKSLRAEGEAELAIANAIWMDGRSTISSDFERVCREIYEAEARTLDFQRPSAAETINAWVSEKTQGKIPSIVTPEAVRGAYLILTNAIYFKAKFQKPFKKRWTQRQPFYLANGGEKEVEMMRVAGLENAYRKGKGFEAAVLNYRDTEVALYMVLPNKGKAPEQVLTEESLREMVRSNYETKLHLEMPRFTMDFSHSLQDSLRRMGMGVAFEYPGADFSAMGSPLAYINEVVHKTRLEVDEEGTVAAAATAVFSMEAAAMRPPEPKTLVFDRPFAVMLRDRRTRAVLFLGVVYEP